MVDDVAGVIPLAGPGVGPSPHEDSVSRALMTHEQLVICIKGIYLILDGHSVSQSSYLPCFLPGFLATQLRQALRHQ